MKKFETTLDWYKALPITSKSYINEDLICSSIDSGVDFMKMMKAKVELSKGVLGNVLKRKSRVVMFGAGGTASWFLPKLLKIYNDAFHKRQDLAYELEIIVVDRDFISSKNVLRQNFIASDIGANKAERLAERYGNLYPNITVSAIPLYGTSLSYDEKVLELAEPASPEHYLDIDKFFQRDDIIINLVDNESFKRKLDYVIYQQRILMYFNAGINLHNGQVYVSYPNISNLYCLDHQDLITEQEELSLHSCADADAEGSDDNPEQMFNGNDMAASLLANLYQSAISQVISHRKIKFTCGGNVSIDKALPTYASLFFAYNLNISQMKFFEEKDIPDDFPAEEKAAVLANIEAMLVGVKAQEIAYNVIKDHPIVL